jgi:hypothetical protein
MFAPRCVIHCIEDQPQPCHVGDNHDRGGNDTQFRFCERGTNMHALWGTKLGQEYYDANLPVVRQRLVLAGLRLAMVLNGAFSADQPAGK